MNFKFAISFCVKHIKILLKHIQNHFCKLLLDLDQVKEINAKNDLSQDYVKSVVNNKKHNLIYLFPFVTFFYLNFETVVIIFLAHFKKDDSLISLKVSYRISPQSLWQMSDLMIEMGLVMGVIIFFFLLTGDKLDSKYIMYLVVKNETTNHITIFQNKKGKQFITITNNFINKLF